MKNTTKYLKYIGNVLAVLSVVFVVYAITQMEFDVSNILDWNVIMIIGVLGCVLCMASTMLFALAWQRILDYLSGEKIKYVTVYKIYAKANLGKYIPGNVMHYVERNIFAGQIGVGQAEVALASVMEIVGQIIAALLLSIILSYRNLVVVLKELFRPQYMIIILVLIFLLISAIFLCIKKIPKLKRLIFKIKTNSFWKMFMVNVLIYMLTLLLLGMIMIMLVSAMKGNVQNVGDMKVIITAYVIAWLLGFIVPGAPGGIGVREFVISIITKNTSIGTMVLLAAVVHRVITVAGDIVSYILGKVFAGGNK